MKWANFNQTDLKTGQEVILEVVTNGSGSGVEIEGLITKLRYYGLEILCIGDNVETFYHYTDLKRMGVK